MMSMSWKSFDSTYTKWKRGSYVIVVQKVAQLKEAQLL